jgi:hypothetical protein
MFLKKRTGDQGFDGKDGNLMQEGEESRREEVPASGYEYGDDIDPESVLLVVYKKKGKPVFSFRNAAATAAAKLVAGSKDWLALARAIVGNRLWEFDL